MFKFKTGRRKDFKTEEAFLKDVYQKNLSAIPPGTTENMFINQVQAHKVAYETNITGALNKLANKSQYTPYTERAGDNVMSALQRHGMLKKFKTMIRDREGKFRAYDHNKLVWNSDQGVYIYDNRIVIDIRESPERIILRTI